MLLEFSVTNFRSIKEKQTLSLLKTKKNELPNNFTTVTLSTGKTLDVLNSAVIYGANASGKSNLLLAMGTMIGIINNDLFSFQLDSVEPFLLSTENKSLPTEFEIDFIGDGVRYVYGFSAIKNKIIDEWLYQYPKGRPQALIERENTDSWGAMTALRGNKNTWQESTRDNSLFLTTAISLNAKKLIEIKAHIKTVFKLHEFQHIEDTQIFHQSKKPVIDFLQMADDAIIDFDIKESLERVEGDGYDISTYRQLENGNKIKFNFYNESKGTQKIFYSSVYWINALHRGLTLVLDELQNSLHPKLVEHLIKMFHDPEVNKKGAQLIFVTHETSLLDQEVFRRDQVWFCEKEDNATELFSLADFSVRKGHENIEKFYLSGRYGAVPYLRN